MLRNAQASARSVQISSSISKPNPAPKPKVTWKLDNPVKSFPDLTLPSSISPNFDQEIDRLFQEFDEKCAKLWKEDTAPNVFPTPVKPSASSQQPRFRQTKQISLCKPPQQEKDRKNNEVMRTNMSQKIIIKDPIQLDISLQQEKKITPDKFEVVVDVTGFELSELSVSTEGERLLIHAKTKKIAGNPGRISRELKRDYQLPETVDPYDVTAKLVTYGQLCIEAPIQSR